MVGPAARLAERVHVRTPEEVCLDVHLLDVEFPGDDFPMHPLMAGLKRRVCPHIAIKPVCFCNSATACASRQESASGISTWTCLPASRHAIDCAACIWVGVQRITASSSLRARLSASSVVTCGMPYFAAISFVGSILWPTSETTSTSAMSLMPSRCLIPNAPAPASATLMVFATSIVLQDQMPHGGVAGRHMVEAMPETGLLAAIHIVHGATSYQPHHQFDPLAASLADVVNMRHAGKTFGVGNQPIKKGVV